MCNQFMLLILALLRFVKSERVCNETLQCTSNTMTEEYIICDGFYGCTESIITAENIICDGANSCLESALTATSSTSTTSSIQCSGKSSCYNTSKVYCDGMIMCQGQYSCGWSKELTSNTMGVNCGGYMSCMHANIVNSGLIIANGERALVNANIESKNAMIWFNKMEGIAVTSMGFMSGNGANIYCRNGKSCTLRCDGTGCLNLNIYCFYGSDCIIDPNQCQNNTHFMQQIQGIKCPKVYISNNIQDDETLNNLIQQREIQRIYDLNKFFNDDQEKKNREHIIKKIKYIENENKLRYYNKLDGIMSVSLVIIIVFIAFCAYHTININQSRNYNKY